MRSLLFILLFVASLFSASGQQILLLTEDFEAPSNTFAFDTGGLGGTAGTNKWIINNQFDGQGVYPNTTNQDSTTFGTITNAPFSTYLHIHDETAASGSGVANTNYDPAIASDRFVYTSRGFCTLGMVNIVLAFFYVGEGSSSAYGEVYYSRNGGAWTKTGAAQYSNQTKWRYVTVTDPVFENATDLRFGFRWVNNAGTPPASISFGLDDIIVVGTYDALNNPVNITIPQVFPSPVCRLNNLIMEWRLSEPLCDGTYRVELSNSAGNFGTNPTSLGVFGISTLDTSGFIAATIPGSTPPGNCYRVRINRMSPPPVITGTASACFIVQTCPNIITTMTPIVATDPDTVCSQSAIDIPFTSTGVYNGNNVYIAQLSDENGKFTVNDTTFLPPDTLITPADTIIIPIDTTYIPADTIYLPPDTIITPADTIILMDTTIILADTTIIPNMVVTPRNVFQVIGTLPSSKTFDPAIGAMPGTVSGLLPVTPEGCNYFIRIISTSPSATGSLYGPFCIKHCDITTNNTLDIHICIHETVGLDDTVQIDINSWNTNASYLAGNSFIVQLLDMMTLGVVNEGGLGITFDTTSTTLILHVPGLNDLLLLGIAPGAYYMRIIADNSTNPNNDLGTIIRLTIGAPADVPSFIIPDDSVYCNSEIGTLQIVPYNPDSDYEWLAAAFWNGVPTVVPGDRIRIDWTGAPVDDYTFRVREINFGCYGPYSPPVTVFVVSLPDVNISGQPVACRGDTFTYSVSFLPKTYYEWDISWGRIIDTSNNEIQVVFDSVGSVTLNLYALNVCGVRTNSFNIEVVSIVDVNAGNDTTVCRDISVKLEATGAGFEKFVLTTLGGGSGGNGNMFEVSANDDIIITGFDGHFAATGTRDMAIYYKSGSYLGFETDSNAWTLLGQSAGIVPNGMGVATPILIPVGVSIPAGNVVSFYITTTNNTIQTYTNGTAAGALYKTDGILNFYEGCGNFNGLFNSNLAPRIWNGIIHYFTEKGISYLWNTGDTTSIIHVAPAQTTRYVVQVNDTNGCVNFDDVVVSIYPDAVAFAGNDTTVCLGTTMSLQASGGEIYTWENNDELSELNIANPVANPRDSTIYVVHLVDSNGCADSDSIVVNIFVLDQSLDSLPMCKGDQGITLSVPEVQGSIYRWSTGESTASIMVNELGSYLAEVGNEVDQCIQQFLFEVIEDNCNSLTVPKAFTPNGDDKNPNFTVFGDNIDEYQIKIFNRWGEMVYYSSDPNELNDINKGWDGTFKGKIQQSGVFVYYIRAKDSSGTSIEKQGNLTLIR